MRQVTPITQVQLRRALTGPRLLVNLTGFDAADIPLAAVRCGGRVATTTGVPDDATLAAGGLTGGSVLAQPGRDVLASLVERAAAGTLRIDVDAVLPLETGARRPRHYRRRKGPRQDRDRLPRLTTPSVQRSESRVALRDRACRQVGVRSDPGVRRPRDRPRAAQRNGSPTPASARRSRRVPVSQPRADRRLVPRPAAPWPGGGR
jgi:hypothetical protein